MNGVADRHPVAGHSGASSGTTSREVPIPATRTVSRHAGLSLLYRHSTAVSAFSSSSGSPPGAHTTNPVSLRSVTPFTPPRYPKRHADWPAFLREEVTRELANRDLPAPAEVTLLEGHWQAWRRYRPSARTRQDPLQGQANRASAFLRITFDEPVAGPVALGHLSHFGLGLFVPER